MKKAKGEDAALRQENPSLKRQLKELKRINSLLSTLQDYAQKTHFALVLSPRGKVRIEWGEEVLRQYFGAVPDSLPPSPPPFLCPESYREFKTWWKRLLQGETASADFRVKTQPGKTCWIRAFGHPHWAQSGKKVSRITGNFQDITSQKETERALIESQARFEALFNAAPDLIYFKDKKGRYLLINEAFEQAFGLKKETILGKGDEDILPAELAAQCRRSDEEAVAKGKAVIKEEVLAKTDSQEIVFETIKAPIFSHDGSPMGLVGISRDITQRKEAEAALRSLVKEKETLLKEIHHRVKNNMQVISSLLSLQAQKLEDQKAVQALKECQERIHSMALVHDKLYQQEALHRIEFSSYLRSLATQLFHAYQVDASLIQLRVEAEEISLNLNTAIPCGLIVNELVTNALKHAFSPGEKGELVISLQRGQKEGFVLAVKDNGRGLPEDLNLKKPDTLGLEIVHILVNQLGGKLQVKVDGGTEFRITFGEQSPSLSKE